MTTEAAAPLRWDDGALLVLDQRLLPGEEAWVRCETPEQVADCIRTLAVRGAPAIGLAAAYGMALARDAGDDARAARPAARHAPDRRQPRLGASTGARGGRPARLGARGSTASSSKPTAALAELGAERFAQGDRALTHCNTGALATGGFGTAGGVLRAAWERGRLAQVWVDETRPLLQGARLTAWELGRAGIPFRVVADSAAGGLMARGLVDRVVVGRRPHRRQRRRGEQGRHLPARGAGRAPRRPVLRGGAGLDDRPAHAPAAREIPIEERDPAEVTRATARRVQPRLRRHPRRAGHGDLHRGGRARATI